MSPFRLGLALMVLTAPSAFGEEEEANGVSFSMSKGAIHLLVTNAVIGAGAASILLVDTLSARTGGPDRTGGGAAAVGILVLFLGSGLTAGHLLDPTLRWPGAASSPGSPARGSPSACCSSFLAA